VDTIGLPSIKSCAVFNGGNYCTKCFHYWEQHSHVLYELQEEIVTLIDIQIKRGLKELADAIILKQTAVQQINDINREYRQEYSEVQKVAA
jgi:hypothetical protein